MQTPQPGSPDPLDLRCSDADRERVADALREAASDGRLTMDELEERLHAAFSAKTFRDLQPITHDLGLPAPRPPSAPPALPRERLPQSQAPHAGLSRVGGIASGTSAVAIFAGVDRRGDWVVPAQFTAFAMFGGIDLDLREARFAEPEVTINASAIFGGIDISVPEDLIVLVEGVGVFGGYDSAPPGNPSPAAPVVRITGLALFGGVSVKRKPPRDRKAIEGGGSA